MTELVGIEATNLSGDLDAAFCNESSGILQLNADCGGDDPKVTCSCCTRCCKAFSCEDDPDQVCRNYASDWEANKFLGTASCECASDGLSFDCTFGDCETCNEELTVCGATKEFEFLFTNLGVIQSATSSFQYTRGRNNATISWEEFADGSCKVYVDGRQCESCSTEEVCRDGFNGITIDCHNVLDNQDGPAIYQSCFPKEGGVLDIFGWIDTGSYIGCPLLSLRALLS